MNRRAVIYSRVSTDKEEQESSLKHQRDYYAKYAKEQGFELVGEYYDEGLSATSSNRKYFIKMLEDAGLQAIRDGNSVTFKVDYDKEPLFDWIIIKDASRFARNVNTVDIVRNLRDKSVYIEFEGLGFTSKDTDWEMRLSLFLTFAQEESLSTSRKLRDAYRQRAEKGKFHMSVNLLGFTRDEETKEYIIKEDEAEIVRKIFDYYTKDKIGGYEIGDKLNEQGYKTKRGRRWNGNNVLRVLRNEKYKGQVIQNKYGTTDITGSNRRVINPKDEWIIHDDALPKIVSVEQFDKAQKIMTSRTRTTVKNKGSSKRQVRGRKIVRNVFYKKIYCSICGADYIRESSTKIRGGKRVREYFYGCRNRRNAQRNREKCMNRGISHNVLERELIKIGKKLSEDRFNEWYIEDERKALNKKLDEIDKLIENSEQEIAKIDDKIKHLDQQISNLFDTLASGASDTVIRLTHEQIELLEDKQKKLEASKVDFSIITLENKKREYNDKFDKIVELSKKESYTFDELLEQVDKITIYHNGRVFVKFNTLTLIDTLPKWGNFLHKDKEGKPTIMYWFGR